MCAKTTRIAFRRFLLIFVSSQFNADFPRFIETWQLPDRPLTPPPTFSAGWFKNRWPRLPLLPPALQFRFPINLVRSLVSLLPCDPSVSHPPMTAHNRCYTLSGTRVCQPCAVPLYQVFKALTSSHQDHRKLRVLSAALDTRLLRPRESDGERHA